MIWALGRRQITTKKEISKDIRSSGWGDLIFYVLFFLFLIGCIIYALRRCSETPSVPKDSSDSSVTDQSEQEQQQQNKQKEKGIKVKIKGKEQIKEQKSVK